MFLVYSKLGREKDSAPLGTSLPASRLWMEAMDSRLVVWDARSLQTISSFPSDFRLESRFRLVGPITLDLNSAGARSAGNLLIVSGVLPLCHKRNKFGRNTHGQFQ